MTPLFRREAVDHASTSRYGTIILINGLSVKMVAIGGTLIAASLLGGLFDFSYQRKVQVTGVISPESGVQRITPMQSGMVVSTSVKEGQHVHKGDALLVINSTLTSATRGDIGQGVSTLLFSRRQSLVQEQGTLALQSQEHQQALQLRADSLSREIQQNDDQILLQKRRVALTAEDLRRAQDLQEQKFVSASAVEVKQGDLLDQEQRLAELSRVKSANARERATALADIRDAKISAEIVKGTSDQNISAIDQQLTENEGRRQIVITAPQDGQVTAISTEIGQPVQAAQVLLTLVPEHSKMLAELYAPSRAAGFVKTGMDVMVDYPAFPYQKFGHQHGKVIEISDAAMRQEDMTSPGATLASQGEQVYRIRVALDNQSVTAYGEEKPLKSGMAVEARVVLDERTIAEWVLEPLWSLKGRL